MLFTPEGSSSSLVREKDGTPVGTLANYAVTRSAIPVDPQDTNGQIPTMSAEVTDALGDTKALIDDAITLRDWTGAKTTANVVTINRSSNSGLTSLDTSTIYSRLNSEQTTYPVIMTDNDANRAAAPQNALLQWCLMAGVPQYRTPGNLLQCIPTATSGTIGYIGGDISAFRYASTVSGWAGFVPTAAVNTPPLEVNPAQSLMMGALFYSGRTLSEFRINASIPSLQTTAIYTVRRNGTTWTVREKVGTAAETVLLTATHAETTSSFQAVYVRVSANAATDKVDVTLRIVENGAYGIPDPTEDTFTDFTASAVTSTLRKRPRPSKVEMGYDTTLAAGHTNKGAPLQYFLSEGTELPEKFPVLQITYTGPRTFAGEDVNGNFPSKIPGFTSNVWERMREFCSIIEMDIGFDKDTITFVSRQLALRAATGEALPVANVVKADLTETVANRDAAKAIEVNLREFDGDEGKFANTEMWRSDSVYSLAKGEVREETIETTATFTQLFQPVPVSGVPVPYTSTFGSYVITGNDGYIVDPQWWKDNGGSITVAPTAKAGEIKITMRAPAVETVRAPYRVSEGQADRPALYIFGAGMKLDKPTVLKIYTGNPDAAQDVGVTFDSPFITSKAIAYNTGHKLAVTYGTAESTVSFSVGRDTLAKPAGFISGVEYNRVPDNALVYWNGSNYRITQVSLTPQLVSVQKAERYNSIAAINESLGAGFTVDDWNLLHAGKKIRDINLAPLKNYIG